MLVWLTLPFYDFCGFRSVAVKCVYKLQFFYIYNNNNDRDPASFRSSRGTMTHSVQIADKRHAQNNNDEKLCDYDGRHGMRPSLHYQDDACLLVSAAHAFCEATLRTDRRLQPHVAQISETIFR